MEKKPNPESERAYRIQLRINACHVALTNIYENIVDRDFDSVLKEIKYINTEMRFLIKALEDDDF
jgi:hypothetical protein